MKKLPIRWDRLAKRNLDDIYFIVSHQPTPFENKKEIK
jgi:hypothetical protein